MQELEKILGEIDEATRQEDAPIYCGNMEVDGYVRMSVVEGIIRKYLENDGWIPTEKELPPLGQRLQATILHHEWIADYNSSWAPDEEKSYHPEYTEVCEIYPVKGEWYYACSEEEYERDVAYINPEKNLGNPISEIIAWRPMPEPYRPERRRKA